MPLNRILTRMAVVSALTNFGKAPWPTVAKGWIYDSKIEPSEQEEDEKPEAKQRPIAVIYTDYDKDFFIFRNKLQAPRMMSITMELLVVQAPEEVMNRRGQPTGVWQMATPTTDSELETTLDLFERQVFKAIQADNPAGEFFNTMVIGYDNVISRRGAAVTGGQRLAARQTTIETNLLRDPEPGKVPPVTRKFLEACINEPKSDYKDRAADLLAIMEDPEGNGPTDFSRKAMGLSVDDAVDLYGAAPRPYALLPKEHEIRWVDRQNE